jgi:hypothetical protein
MKLRGETGTGLISQCQRSSSRNRVLRVAHLQHASRLHEILCASSVRCFGIPANDLKHINLARKKGTEI